MVLWALESLHGLVFSDLILVALDEHRQSIERELHKLLQLGVKTLYRRGVSDGQLCSALEARNFLDTEEDLLILGADTYVVSPLGQDIQKKRCDCKGILSVADVPGDRWSFARAHASGRVVEVAEKRRISHHACTGLYYFSHAREFVRAAEQIVRLDMRVRGEFYVIQVYDAYIQRGWYVSLSPGHMWDMGTPEALETFLCNVPETPGNLVDVLATQPRSG
jgi:dTDP-glucose pyrophosphorylase